MRISLFSVGPNYYHLQTSYCNTHKDIKISFDSERNIKNPIESVNAVSIILEPDVGSIFKAFSSNGPKKPTILASTKLQIIDTNIIKENIVELNFI